MEKEVKKHEYCKRYDRDYSDHACCRSCTWRSQDITAGPIAQQQEQSKQEAYKAVFEDADSFEVYDVDADALAANLAENNFNAQTINEIMEAKDASGETIGYALNVTDSEGYGGDIQFTMGIQNDGT